MSLLPSPFTQTPTATEQFIKIPYSRQPSPLTPAQEAIQEAQEAEAKQTMTASAMAGTAVGVAGAAGAVAIISSLFQKPPNGQQQKEDNQQKDDQTRKRRRLRRPKLDDDDEEDEDDDDDDDDGDGKSRVKDMPSEEDDESMPDRSPSRENVTITHVDENRPSVFGLLRKELTRNKHQDSSMNILSHYFPVISSIIDDNHYFKYTLIEQYYGRNRAIQDDIHTRFIDSNMYISIISKSPVEMSDILDFIGNPLRPRANIIAMYNHETNTIYGECNPIDERRIKIRPNLSTYDSVLEYTTMYKSHPN